MIDCEGVVEADPEYLLIVEANNLAADIDHELNTVHKYARFGGVLSYFIKNKRS